MTLILKQVNQEKIWDFNMIKSVLQLKASAEDDFVFAQPLEKDFDHSIGDILEYTSFLYNKLNEQEKTTFAKCNLKIGHYRVQKK